MAWPSEYDVVKYMASGGLLSGGFGSGQIGLPHFASGLSSQILGLAGRSLLDQTANNSGAIITVSGPGLYRVTSYVEVTQGGLLNAGNLSVRFDWTSETQQQNATPVAGVALVTTGAFGQSNILVRAMSGTPIIQTVQLGSLVGTPHYNAFAAVERVF